LPLQPEVSFPPHPAVNHSSLRRMRVTGEGNPSIGLICLGKRFTDIITPVVVCRNTWVPEDVGIQPLGRVHVRHYR
jgi:hypothetical protein